MALITETDIAEIIYQERLDEIKRDDAEFINNKIKGAVDEAKSYLSRYDLDALFGTDDQAATVSDQNLKDKVVDLACWRICKRASAGVDTELIQLSYDKATKWLRDVQKGDADPAGWPLKPANSDNGTQPGSQVTWSSNPKSRQHY